MKSGPISPPSTPTATISVKPADGVLSIKGPYGQSLLLLVLSGDTNCAQLDIQIGQRLYTLDIRPKLGSAISGGNAADIAVHQARALEQRKDLSLPKISFPPGAVQDWVTKQSP
jgi:hypothetical protein